VKANRAYELRVNRGRELDSIEVLEIDTGEIALFWDTLPGQTGKLARALRADLAQLEAHEFLALWERYQVT
jgi:hypothetical protein